MCVLELGRGRQPASCVAAGTSAPRCGAACRRKAIKQRATAPDAQLAARGAAAAVEEQQLARRDACVVRQEPRLHRRQQRQLLGDCVRGGGLSQVCLGQAGLGSTYFPRDAACGLWVPTRAAAGCGLRTHSTPQAPRRTICQVALQLLAGELPGAGLVVVAQLGALGLSPGGGVGWGAMGGVRAGSLACREQGMRHPATPGLRAAAPAAGRGVCRALRTSCSALACCDMYCTNSGRLIAPAPSRSN